MPRRSNTFQRLATLIHERLGVEWEVVESHMFTDLVTGELREVDIVAKTIVASYPIYLSVECRDHARPADVIWVEGAAKKHEHLSTSKLVLWSRSGFTKAALLKAQALKITTVSQAEAVSPDWAKLARKLIGGYIQHVAPTYTAFIDVNTIRGEPLRLEDVLNSSWHNNAGAIVGTVQTLIQLIGSSPQIRTCILDNARVGDGSFYIELEPPEPWFTELPEGGQAPIRRIGVSMKTFTEKASLATASALTDGKVTTLASAKLSGGVFELVIDELPDGNTTVRSKLLSEKA